MESLKHWSWKVWSCYKLNNYSYNLNSTIGINYYSIKSFKGLKCCSWFVSVTVSNSTVSVTVRELQAQCQLSLSVLVVVVCYFECVCVLSFTP